VFNKFNYQSKACISSLTHDNTVEDFSAHAIPLKNRCVQYAKGHKRNGFVRMEEAVSAAQETITRSPRKTV
jgi:hypothetical protein